MLQSHRLATWDRTSLLAATVINVKAGRGNQISPNILHPYRKRSGSDGLVINNPNNPDGFEVQRHLVRVN